MIGETFVRWQQSNEFKLSLWLNHLLVVYAFLLPLDHPRAGAFIVWMMVGIVMIRGHFRDHFSGILKHPIVIASLLFYLLHWVWNIQLSAPPLLVHTFKENVEYFLLIPLFLAIADSRFTLRIISAFLISIMFSEIVSYGMYFGFLPYEWTFHAVNLPWHSTPRDIMIYSQGAFYVDDPAPFLKHSVYTAALAFSVAVLVYRLLNDTLRLPTKIIVVLFILTMTYNISIVGGRAGYFIYIALLAIVLIRTYKRKALLPMGVLVGILSIIGVSAYAISPMFQHRIDYTLHNAAEIWKEPSNFSSSEGGRIGMWYYGSDVIQEYPWFGVPEADFVKVVHERIPLGQRDVFEQWYFMPHSFYLSTLLQFGVIGLILLLNLFYQSIRYRHENDEFNTIRILAVVMIAMSYISSDPIEYFFFPLLALIVAVTTTKRQYLPEVREENVKMAFGYFLLAAAAFAAAVLQ